MKRIRQKWYENAAFEEDLLQYTRSGSPYWVHIHCFPIGPEQGVKPGFIAIQNNISDRKNSERGLRIAASVFDRSHEAVLITDHNNRILDVNPAFSRITGYSRNEVLGLNPAILSSGRHTPEYYRSMWHTIERTDHWRGEIWNRRKNGEEYAELLSISRVHLDQPGQFYHVAAFSDITALKNHARELDRAANYDVLTGLPNRQLLEERLRTARSHADRLRQGLSVCYLDLGLITLEVLESTALEDTQRASNVLSRCRCLGLKVALDDFGTGFSSLTYLRTLPVDMIKIDQSFVFNMLEDSNDRAIVESVIFLAQRFAHPVLAEGVETMAHALQQMGCKFVQGYGIARPHASRRRSRLDPAMATAGPERRQGRLQKQFCGKLFFQR